MVESRRRIERLSKQDDVVDEEGGWIVMLENGSRDFAAGDLL